VTTDTDAAREIIDKILAMYPSLPSYRAMMDLEGATRPSDIALIGDEDAVRKAVAGIAEAGVTDLHCAVIGAGGDIEESAERTYGLVADLARSAS